MPTIIIDGPVTAELMPDGPLMLPPAALLLVWMPPPMLHHHTTTAASATAARTAVRREPPWSIQPPLQFHAPAVNGRCWTAVWPQERLAKGACRCRGAMGLVEQAEAHVLRVGRRLQVGGGSGQAAGQGGARTVGKCAASGASLQRGLCERQAGVQPEGTNRLLALRAFSWKGQGHLHQTPPLVRTLCMQPQTCNPCPAPRWRVSCMHANRECDLPGAPRRGTTP